MNTGRASVAANELCKKCGIRWHARCYDRCFACAHPKSKSHKPTRTDAGLEIGRPKKTAYELRDEALLELGFLTYENYLESDLWKGIRARVLDRDHHRCVSCRDKASQVHHLAYDRPTLRGKKLDKLVSICRPCHEEAEFAEGTKTSLRDANARIKTARAVNGD